MEIIKEVLTGINEVLNYKFHLSEKIGISVRSILIVIAVMIITSKLLNLIRRVITRKLPDDDKAKFRILFSYGKWFLMSIILLVTFDFIGIDVTAVLAASAALLIGVGLALQTLFQDIISGVFILLDQTLHVGDIIEVDGKTGRVEEIKLRTTRAVTIDNRVLIIPNHLYLANSLYNWTQNGTLTRESVWIGVAYGSDVQLVKKLLLQAANENDIIFKHPAPTVFFEDFGDSALMFRLVFTINDSFAAVHPKSEVRFAIDRLFRENNVSIPFPQRDIHIIEPKSK